MLGTCEHYVQQVVYVITLLLYKYQKAMYLIRKAPYSPCGTFLFTTKHTFTLNAYADYQALHTSKPIFSRVSTDIIGCVWTGEYDLNTLHGDGELFKSGKDSGIQNYMDSYGWGLNLPNMLQKNALFITVFKLIFLCRILL